MKYADGGGGCAGDFDEEEEWGSDGEDGGWDSDLSDADGQECDYPDESDEGGGGRGWGLGGSSSDSSIGGHGADDY
jgi:hypothetical protein|eukprot:COSAG06_NODE_3718_length_4977_cov_4.743542_2_plen_76_part_00